MQEECEIEVVGLELGEVLLFFLALFVLSGSAIVFLVVQELNVVD